MSCPRVHSTLVKNNLNPIYSSYVQMTTSFCPFCDTPGSTTWRLNNVWINFVPIGHPQKLGYPNGLDRLIQSEKSGKNGSVEGKCTLFIAILCMMQKFGFSLNPQNGALSGVVIFARISMNETLCGFTHLIILGNLLCITAPHSSARLFDKNLFTNRRLPINNIL